MSELVVARKGKFEGDTEGLDGHNRHRSDQGADAEVDQGVLLAIYGSNSVDHEDGEGCHRYGIYQEACRQLASNVAKSEAFLFSPGLSAYARIVSMVSMSSSGGACNTMMTAPIRQMAHPSLPNMPSSSLRKYEPSTAPISTESAPRGVTRMAGAKAYAAKLQTSPTTTASRLSVCWAGQSLPWC